MEQHHNVGSFYHCNGTGKFQKLGRTSFRLIIGWFIRTWELVFMISWLVRIGYSFDNSLDAAPFCNHNMDSKYTLVPVAVEDRLSYRYLVRAKQDQFPL